jgi:hypothetical protein
VTYRNRKLLDLAHDMPCQARFPHVCNGPSVPAHSNQQIFGRGFSHKSPDCFFAAVCPAAHDAIDGRAPGMDRETKQAEWQRAYIATIQWLWENEKLKVA